jgi:hypothetical protein
MLPMNYRAGEPDPVTEDVRRKLQDACRYEFMVDQSGDGLGGASRHFSDNSLVDRDDYNQASLRNAI